MGTYGNPSGWIRCTYLQRPRATTKPPQTAVPRVRAARHEVARGNEARAGWVSSPCTTCRGATGRGVGRSGQKPELKCPRDPDEGSLSTLSLLSSCMKMYEILSVYVMCTTHFAEVCAWGIIRENSLESLGQLHFLHT